MTCRQPVKKAQGGREAHSCLGGTPTSRMGPPTTLLLPAGNHPGCRAQMPRWFPGPEGEGAHAFATPATCHVPGKVGMTTEGDGQNRKGAASPRKAGLSKPGCMHQSCLAIRGRPLSSRAVHADSLVRHSWPETLAMNRARLSSEVPAGAVKRRTHSGPGHHAQGKQDTVSSISREVRQLSATVCPTEPESHCVRLCKPRTRALRKPLHLAITGGRQPRAIRKQ